MLTALCPSTLVELHGHTHTRIHRDTQTRTCTHRQTHTSTDTHTQSRSAPSPELLFVFEMHTLICPLFVINLPDINIITSFFLCENFIHACNGFNEIYLPFPHLQVLPVHLSPFSLNFMCSLKTKQHKNKRP